MKSNINVAFLAAGVILLGMFQPLFAGLILGVWGVSLILHRWPLEMSGFSWYLLSVQAAFWGPYLALPGWEPLFLFRLMMPLHLIYFLCHQKHMQLIHQGKIPLIGLGIWVGTSVLSLSWSDFPHTTLLALYYEFEISYFICFSIYYLNTLDRVRRFAHYLGLNYFIILSYSLIFEYILGQHLRFSKAYASSYDMRPTGMLVNTNDFAVFLVLYYVIWLIPQLTRIGRGKNQRLLSLKVTSIWLTLFFLIIQTSSRSGFVALVLVTLVLMGHIVSLKMRLITLLLASCVAILQLVRGHLSMISLLLLKLQNTFMGKMNSTHERMRIYRYAFFAILEKPYGYGAGSSLRHVYYLLKGYMNLPEFNQQSMGMHNFVLAVFFETGVLGVLGISLLLAYYTYQAIKLMQSTTDYLASVPCLILICFFSASVGSSSILEMRTLWIAFSLGLALLMNQQTIKSEISHEKNVNAVLFSDAKSD
ncbi:O-antigen ligase family protein [Latilactobacillus graminis]|uniref:O-antigen ligase-related domain-containing protein n=2 Tax=Latilactobacillus graminis TaxID=60519 RepID=A0AA89I1P8_9LACO|nr:O-antigen ligase family protein [Latilactobacillus graminis]KRM21205.1 hypothetical protein FC90_GL001742 [Latilactobacillus graminis DSM 20719]QFP79331.1 hypothetical protein LG542_03395 [Latilactobacillus graminis]